MTSENVFSNECADYLTGVPPPPTPACHSSAQITGTAFDMPSAPQMTLSSVLRKARTTTNVQFKIKKKYQNLGGIGGGAPRIN